MKPTWSRTGLSIAATIALAAGAPASDTPPPEPPASPAPVSTPQPRPAEGIRVAPVDQADGHHRPNTGVLLAEGTFVANRRGWVDRLSNGDWQFTFEDAPDAPALAPMTLHPCQRLAEIVRIVEARPERVILTISGRIFVYAGHNFLLPTVFATATQQNEATTEEAKKPAASGPIDAANPSLEELVAEVDQATRPVENPRTAAPSSAPSSDGAPRLRREGTAIVSQSGRLSRGGRNWVFTIDNDADTTPGAEEVAPLELLPCLNLSEMERLFERHGNNLRFTISGAVYTFKERNMLLPTMYVIDIDRDGNLTSAQ